ncbi:MAG TPA: PEP/pyruvate-binding domain-containing protein [Planctomycetota bacterium]|jgi:alpha-glucan,water dikinase
MTREEVLSFDPIQLKIRRSFADEKWSVEFQYTDESDCILNWGLIRGGSPAWRKPAQENWPPETKEFRGALQTDFAESDDGTRSLTLSIPAERYHQTLAFVLYQPQTGRWLKHQGKDGYIPLERMPGTDVDEIFNTLPEIHTGKKYSFDLNGGEKLRVSVVETPDAFRVCMLSDVAQPLVLHWGVAYVSKSEWRLPEPLPPDTTVFNEKAARTPFVERESLAWLELALHADADKKPRALSFVLFQPDIDGWIRNSGPEFFTIPLSKPSGPKWLKPPLDEIAEDILDAEVAATSWTLMHRLHLCYSLMAREEHLPAALPLLYTWMRYSATRQLDWQRNYNTKPRELSAAQDRLTLRIAEIWSRCSGARPWLRLLLDTVGRGGEGQRVRDEILHILHRNHIKEVHGTFLEEWHQKLHNNTTPDDVVICLAYLAFLRSNGNQDAFYSTLQHGGVTRQRLCSFERPIKTDPAFWADRNAALIRDFENYLQVLKSVHSGTDLDIAAGAARKWLDGGTCGALDRVLALRGSSGKPVELADAVISARQGIASRLGSTDTHVLRDLLFVDRALEEALRLAIERMEYHRLDMNAFHALTFLALRNAELSIPPPELQICLQHWTRGGGLLREGPAGARHLKSIADRLSRVLQACTDESYRTLQPLAEFLGSACGVEKWAQQIFSEEVIRGSSVFLLSMLLKHLDPLLRRAAGISGWQIISRHAASGRLQHALSLDSVQTQKFSEPTVLLADTVAGHEEIPINVRGIITLSTPDLVSHIAVRARNAGVLLVSCYEAAAYNNVRGLLDRWVQIKINADESIEATETQPATAVAAGATVPSKERVHLERHTCSKWAITEHEFSSATVGGKASRIRELRQRLPEWIHVPTSVALPFGSCERALELAPEALREQFRQLANLPEADLIERLPELRALQQQLPAPDALRMEFEAACGNAQLQAPPWEHAWERIKQVWASKWNQRATLSRLNRGVDHCDLLMSVLVQQVVEASYAFVLHTTHPTSGDASQIYGEVVLGLGETLVSNHPGRALSFACHKSDLKLEIISFPSKSAGLYGRGLIFRSDSNGEDLEDFAGAGLYDSVLLEEPEKRLLRYQDEPLLWNLEYRDRVLKTIARIGIEVERAYDRPQDIEGAVAGDQFFVVQTRPQVGL